MSEPTVRLLDVPGEQGRTTVSLLGSLAARLATLSVTSGSDVVGSITAGYAALGRAAAQTAEGALMRRAIERSHAGGNGEAIWRTLKIGDWAGTLPPAAVQQQLDNDIALLAATDLDRALGLPLAPAEPLGADGVPEGAPVEFADYLLGMWVFGRSVVTAVEQLTADQLDVRGVQLEAGGTATGERAGPLLR